MVTPQFPASSDSFTLCVLALHLKRTDHGQQPQLLRRGRDHRLAFPAPSLASPRLRLSLQSRLSQAVAAEPKKERRAGVGEVGVVDDNGPFGRDQARWRGSAMFPVRGVEAETPLLIRDGERRIDEQRRLQAETHQPSRRADVACGGFEQRHVAAMPVEEGQPPKSCVGYPRARSCSTALSV
ncbi:MAG: hypothetical protein R2856_32385 [Caldilineaceae bacterium]